MARFIHLVLLTGLIGFSVPQIVACGDDSKDKKKDKDDDKDDKDDDDEDEDDEDDEGSASAEGASPAKLCGNIIKAMEKAGEEVEDGEVAECTEGMEEMKTAMGDELWNEFSSCGMKASDEESFDVCGEAIEDRMEERMKEAEGGE